MCVRRGKRDESGSGGWSQCPDKGIIVVDVGERDWGRALGGGCVHVL